jgi:hypothetical protein
LAVPRFLPLACLTIILSSSRQPEGPSGGLFSRSKISPVGMPDIKVVSGISPIVVSGTPLRGFPETKLSMFRELRSADFPKPRKNYLISPKLRNSN